MTTPALFRTRRRKLLPARARRLAVPPFQEGEFGGGTMDTRTCFFVCRCANEKTAKKGVAGMLGGHADQPPPILEVARAKSNSACLPIQRLGWDLIPAYKCFGDAFCRKSISA
jgi:hypothetical protein